MKINHFNAFVALPKGYRLSDSPSENKFKIENRIGGTNQNIAQKEEGEFYSLYIGSDWPLFDEWRGTFVGRNVVHPKPRNVLDPDMAFTTTLASISDELVSRNHLFAFAFAFLSALFLGVVVNYGGDFLYDTIKSNNRACFLPDWLGVKWEQVFGPSTRSHTHKVLIWDSQV